MARSTACTVSVNGVPMTVLHTNVADFITFACDCPVEVVVVFTNAKGGKATIRPLAKGITAVQDNHQMAFMLPGPMNLMIDIEGANPLLLYANPPETDLPGEGPDVLRFRAGQVYEVGELRLSAGQTLYVEGGAVVRGCIRASDADGVRLCGRGIIDGSYYRRGVDGRRMIVIENSRKVRIDDLIMIEPAGWMISLGACDDVRVSNCKQIGECMCSDGIDIVGSRNILIEGCCLKNNDDCIAIKSLNPTGGDKTVRHDWSNDVENVLVRNCVFMNDRSGNVLEIGHELRTAAIRNITFQDCDLLHCHVNGAVFSIHAGDRATVSDVLFENIRVEHYWDKLVDLRLIKSVHNRDEQRGQIRRVTFRNVHVVKGSFNAGYSISLIGGWDAQHTVQDVCFDGFYLNEQRIRNADELDLHTKHASGIVFK